MRRQVLRRMRFDTPAPPPPKMKPVPQSMMPADLPKTHTPFPLPMYDESMGFGPNRLENIPEVRRVQTLMEEEEVGEADVAGTQQGMSDLVALAQEEEGMDLARQETPGSSPSESSDPNIVFASDPRYRRDDSVPAQVDRLKVNKSPEEVITALEQEQRSHERAAMLCDAASTVDVKTWSVEQLCSLLDKLSSLLSTDAQGLRFFGASRRNSGMASKTPDVELIFAWTTLFDRLEALLVEEHPAYQIETPSVVGPILRVMGQAQILDRRKWYSQYLGHSTGRTTPHPMMNNTTTGRDHCFDYFFHTAFLVKNTPLLQKASSVDIVEIFAGFNAILNGNVPQDIVEAITAELERRHSSEKLEQLTLERLWFVLAMSGVRQEWVEAATVELGSLQEQGLVALSRNVEHFSAEKIAEVCSKSLEEGGAEASLGVATALYAAKPSEALAPAIQATGDALLGALGAEDDLLTHAETSWDAVIESVREFDNVIIAHSTGCRKFHVTLQMLRRLDSGRDCVLVPASALMELRRLTMDDELSPAARENAEKVFNMITFEIANHAHCHLIPFELEHQLRSASDYTEDYVVWDIISKLRDDAPLVLAQLATPKHTHAGAPHHFLTTRSGPQQMEGFLRSTILEQMGDRSAITNRPMLSPATRATVKFFNPKPLTRDRPQRTGFHSGNYRKTAFVTSQNMYDKYHVHGIRDRPGHSKSSDVNFGGLGVYTPDFPQPLPKVSSDEK